MPDVEFFRKSDNKPLHFNDEEKRFEWEQYTSDDWYIRVSDPCVNSVFVRAGDVDFALEKYVSENCFMLSKAVGQQMVDIIQQRTGEQPNPGG